ncbi:MAG: resolvase [Chloroflexi bacterium]|nr:MAG: resolvase [Chloroflexota bacterium]
MSQILAYLRTSTDKQDLDQQRLQILAYADQHQLQIDDFIALQISSRRTATERRLDELFQRLKAGDTLIVTELSRLGRSTGQVISLIDELIQHDIRVIVLKQQLILDRNHNDLQSLAMVTLLSLFAQMERMMISQRTKEALATKKAQGILLGKPKGTIQKSMYDKDRKRIVELLKLGVSIRHISLHHLDYGSTSSLHYYVITRQLKPD